MPSIFRPLMPIFRSRRHSSFLFALILLLCVIFFLFSIQHSTQSTEPSPSPIIIDKHSPFTSGSNTRTIEINRKKGLWPIDEKGRSLKEEFLVMDLTGFFGSGAAEGEIVRCPSSNTTFTWTRQHSRLDEIDFFISHDAASGDGVPFERLHLDNNQQQYTMAFIMESEVHSSTGDAWKRFHFKMSYNLDDSYPEPATYFDTNIHIVDLLKPVRVPFEEKEKQADIVWIISNCNAHNGRESFVQRLMEEIKIDSYGSCLNNRQGYGARMADNVNAYIKYKFVLAIENSNCVDYVTEKLVKAVESGSIPIVAGRNGRPDYRRYMPEHSYINIYDYPSIKSLAEDLKRIASNKTLYESYLWYKKHQKNIDELKKLPLEEKIQHLREVIGSNATMITEGIVGKEKSENKICKLIRFVRQTPWQTIAEHPKTVRTGPTIACLPHRGILTYFDSVSSNTSQKEKL